MNATTRKISIHEQNQIAEQIARVFDSHGVTVEDMQEINELVESLTKVEQ